MFIAKITNDYDIITFLDYDNLTLCNCTNNDNSDNNIEIILPLSTIIPCGLPLLYLISLMAYTLIKHLLGKK